MPKAILYGIVFYFIFLFVKKLFFNNKSNLEMKQNQNYKNLDIKDADFEDINND
tara:strand:- start:608 stop:769 length:162 start_codon:yes stop_codon:yes gene_type:complete